MPPLRGRRSASSRAARPYRPRVGPLPSRGHGPFLPLDGPPADPGAAGRPDRARGRRGAAAHPNPELPENAWSAAFDAVIERYAVDDQARRERKSPGWLRHEAILLDSPFSHVEFIAVLERRRRPLERFIDRALSLSSTSATKIGARTADLAAELRAALAPFGGRGHDRRGGEIPAQPSLGGRRADIRYWRRGSGTAERGRAEPAMNSISGLCR